MIQGEVISGCINQFFLGKVSLASVALYVALSKFSASRSTFCVKFVPQC